jgi:hypothetical protein
MISMFFFTDCASVPDNGEGGFGQDEADHWLAGNNTVPYF